MSPARRHLVGPDGFEVWVDLGYDRREQPAHEVVAPMTSMCVLVIDACDKEDRLAELRDLVVLWVCPHSPHQP